MSVTYSLVIPVFNEDGALVENIYQEAHKLLEKGIIQELFVVDDGSEIPISSARRLYEGHRGYGAAIKAAISQSRSVFSVCMDGDGQHQIKDVERLIEYSREFPEDDLVIGDRRLEEESFKRKVGRAFLNSISSILAGDAIPDLNSGMRVIRTRLANGYAPIISEGFSFTTTTTLSMLADGYRVTWIPIRVKKRSHGASHVRLWSDGWRTLRSILWIGMALRTRTLRAFLRRLRGKRSA